MLAANKIMKQKVFLLVLAIFLLCVFPAFSQTLLGRAAGDFYSAFARMVTANWRFDSLDELKPYIPGEVYETMEENLVYRVGFIGFAVSQHGVMNGNTTSAGFANTLNAFTGFIMLLEEVDELEEWTLREISNRYEHYLATSWHNTNVPLFMNMLDAYCSWKRGELWN